MMTFDILPDLKPIPRYIEIDGQRPYQVDIARAVHDGWEDEGCYRQLVVAATGSGKTVMMGGFAKTFAKSDQRTLVLAHTDELITQAQDKFARLTGLPTGREKAGDRASLSDDIVVASVQTMRGTERLRGWPRDHFGLVQVDEAHRTLAKSYMTVLDHFETARVIGMTATPDRGDKQALGQFYQRIAKEYSMLDAINDGWLVRVEIQPISVKIDLNTVKPKRGMDGEADLDMQAVSHRIEPYLGDIAGQIWEHASTRHILGFAPSIDIAKKMVEFSKKAGFQRVDWVAGEDAERTRKIAAYKRGEIQLLWNAMLLTEGFDQDSIDALAILRPTSIRALYQQIVGRGTRPLGSIIPQLDKAPDAAARRAIIAASRKPHVLVFDPLWLHESLNLCEPASLVSKNIEEQKLMKGKQGDLLTIASEASRDLWDALREKLLKNANRLVKRIDPFTFGVVLGNQELAQYQPETLWDARRPTIEQLKLLIDNGVDAESVQWRGQAQKIIDVINERRARGLCSIRAMNFLSAKIAMFQKKLDENGVRPEVRAWLGRVGDPTHMTAEEAQRNQRWLFSQGFR